MLTCEGYKMFEGTAVVTIDDDPTYIYGRWLYRPDTNYWYVNGSPAFPWGTSFPADKVAPLRKEAAG